MTLWRWYLREGLCLLFALLCAPFVLAVFAYWSWQDRFHDWSLERHD